MSFQVQLTSIMEALTAAAVAEITGLLDRSCEALQQEVRRCRAENEALRRKLLTLDPPGNKTTSQHEESGPQSSVIKAHVEERPRGETRCDVVVIKTESDEEGVEVRSIKDEGHEVSVTMKMPVPSVEQWDMSPEQVPSQRSGGSACPANVSPRIELDDTSDSGGEGSSGAARETFGSEPVPDNNAISSWPSPGFGLPCQYLKPASYLSDQLIDMGPGLDAVDRYCRDRRFVCRFCGKRFTSSRILETHVRVHTGERPYSCAQCGKRFTQSGHLKTHQSVHTGERPYACQHCGKRFAGKQNLRIHQQKHHRTEPGDV